MKIASLSLVLLLSACAAKFDGHEYSRMVDIRMELRESSCADDREAHAMINLVQFNINWLQIYSQHLPNNENTTNMLAALAKTLQEMLDRYNTEQSVSPIYCRLKVKTLQEQLDIILKTTSRKER